MWLLPPPPWQQEESLPLAFVPVLDGWLRALRAVLETAPLDLTEASWIVRQDPGLAAHVVRLANHPVGGDEVAPALTIESCLVLAGPERLRRELGRAQGWQLEAEGSEAAPFLQMWAYSRRVARLSDRLARALSAVEPDLAYLGGLLSCLGQIAELTRAGQRWRELSPDDFDEKHAAPAHLGSWLGLHWCFPAVLLDVLEHGARPEAALEPEWVRLVTAAGRVASCCEREPAELASLTTNVAVILHELFSSLTTEAAVALAGSLGQEFVETEFLDTDPAAAVCAAFLLAE
jgi:HD-like signal output (HDOD) protein